MPRRRRCLLTEFYPKVATEGGKLDDYRRKATSRLVAVGAARRIMGRLLPRLTHPPRVPAVVTECRLARRDRRTHTRPVVRPPSGSRRAGGVPPAGRGRNAHFGPAGRGRDQAAQHRRASAARGRGGVEASRQIVRNARAEHGRRAPLPSTLLPPRLSCPRPQPRNWPLPSSAARAQGCAPRRPPAGPAGRPSRAKIGTVSS